MLVPPIGCSSDRSHQLPGHGIKHKVELGSFGERGPGHLRGHQRSDGRCHFLEEPVKRLGDVVAGPVADQQPPGIALLLDEDEQPVEAGDQPGLAPFTCGGGRGQHPAEKLTDPGLEDFPEEVMFRREVFVDEGLRHPGPLRVHLLGSQEVGLFLAGGSIEARHAVLFHRFFKEVTGIDGDISDTLEATLPQLNWGYRGVFDRLDRMADELRADRSLPKFAQAITLYHLIVEGTLAQPGQHYIEDFFNKDGGVPGFSAGMANVSRDEQRHIGFGVKNLSETVPQSEECKAAIVELFREINRYSIGVFCPPAFDRAYTECWGFSMEDIYAFGLKLVRQRWKTIGFPLEEMPDDVWPFDHSLSAEEIVKPQVQLLLAGVTGAPHPSPDSYPRFRGCSLT
ncbi:MAG: ribonucleoside-diphosphate reductase beta chain [Actinomycetota bacterium]|nr:ribonucleoside-diphosphate reductase beta chain [Actinomycetota bacterium]